MKKLNFLIIFFSLFLPINTIYCVESVPNIRKMINKGDEKEAAEAIDERGGAPASIAQEFEKTFGKSYKDALGAPTPPQRELKDQKEYKDAEAAYNAFNADQTNKTNAQTFIDAFEALEKVSKNYTGSIPGTWAILLTTARSVVKKVVPPSPPPVTKVDPKQVLQANQDAAKLANDVAKKIKEIPTTDLPDTDKKKMAKEWNNFSQQVINNFGAGQ